MRTDHATPAIKALLGRSKGTGTLEKRVRSLERWVTPYLRSAEELSYEGRESLAECLAHLRVRRSDYVRAVGGDEVPTSSGRIDRLIGRLYAARAHPEKERVAPAQEYLAMSAAVDDARMTWSRRLETIDDALRSTALLTTSYADRDEMRYALRKLESSAYLRGKAAKSGEDLKSLAWRVQETLKTRIREPIEGALTPMQLATGDIPPETYILVPASQVPRPATLAYEAAPAAAPSHPRTTGFLGRAGKALAAVGTIAALAATFFIAAARYDLRNPAPSPAPAPPAHVYVQPSAPAPLAPAPLAIVSEAPAPASSVAQPQTELAGGAYSSPSATRVLGESASVPLLFQARPALPAPAQSLSLEQRAAPAQEVSHEPMASQVAPAPEQVMRAPERVHALPAPAAEPAAPRALVAVTPHLGYDPHAEHGHGHGAQLHLRSSGTQLTYDHHGKERGPFVAHGSVDLSYSGEASGHALVGYEHKSGFGLGAAAHYESGKTDVRPALTYTLSRGHSHADATYLPATGGKPHALELHGEHEFHRFGIEGMVGIEARKGVEIGEAELLLTKEIGRGLKAVAGGAYSHGGAEAVVGVSIGFK